MKTLKFRCALFATVGIITLVFGIPTAAQAQSTGLRAGIPFEFHVGDQVLPPGTYTVWLRSGGVIAISDGNGKSAASITNAVHRPSAKHAVESILIFNMYGNRVFLSEVQWAGYGETRGLAKSKMEIEYAKSAQAPAHVATVITR